MHQNKPILRQTTLKTIKSTTATAARSNGGGQHFLSSLNRRLTSRSFGIIAANSSTANIKLYTTRRSAVSASMINAQQQQLRYSTLQQQQRSRSSVNQPLISSYGTSTKNINCCGGVRGIISRLMVNNNCSNNIAWTQRCYYSGQQHHQQQSTSSYYHPAAMMMMTAAAAIVGGAASTSTLLTSTATTAMSSSGSSETDCNRQSSTAAGTSTIAAGEGRLWNVTKFAEARERVNRDERRKKGGKKVNHTRSQSLIRKCFPVRESVSIPL